MKCRRCAELAEVALPSHNTAFCRSCFEIYFLRQVEKAVKDHKMILPGDPVLVALSGGKDSLALALALGELGYDITGLHINLDIKGSSEIALQAAENFCKKYNLKLRVLNTKDYGLSIPLVKKNVKRPICSVCGKVKRYFFNAEALENNFAALATGHNLDDETSRLFANTIRWDARYLSSQGPVSPAKNGLAKRIKPLYRLSEFETAVFCFFRGIETAKGACPFSGGASFTGHKKLLAGLESRSPGAKISFYEGFLKNGRPAFAEYEDETPLLACQKCGYPSPAQICGICSIREQLKEKSQTLD